MNDQVVFSVVAVDGGDYDDDADDVQRLVPGTAMALCISWQAIGLQVCKLLAIDRECCNGITFSFSMYYICNHFTGSSLHVGELKKDKGQSKRKGRVGSHLTLKYVSPG